MKLMYLLATSAVVLVMMASCTRQSVTGYTLTAAIDGIPDGSHVQLFPVSHGHEKPVADTIVVDGKFIFIKNLKLFTVELYKGNNFVCILFMSKDVHHSIFFFFSYF